MKRNIVNIIILLFFQCSFAQQLIEEVKKTSNIYDIPFQKYKLDNGLIVILHQDTSVSNVYVNILYKVGSANEIEGKTGYAHLFEHLMFSGTKDISGAALMKLFPKTNSSYMNAQTQRECTIYEEIVPANYLETALWLESERLQHTPEFINEQNVAIQKQVILNEMAMRTEENIYGIFDKNINELLYPENHPLHYPIIGYKEDIENAALDSIRDFFVKWYAPNNAIITISGNLKTEQTLALINKYFAHIPAKELPKLHYTISDSSKIETEKIELNFDINLPYYAITFPTVKRWSEDEATLDALAYLLGQKDNRKRFADDTKMNLYNTALRIDVNNPCNKLAGRFYMIWNTTDKINVDKLISNTFKSIKKNSYLEKNIWEYNEYFKKQTYERFETIRNIGFNLSQYELLLNTPNGLPIEWKRNLSLTKEKIDAAFDKYLFEKPFVEVDIIPYSAKEKKDRKKGKTINEEKLENEELWNKYDFDTLENNILTGIIKEPELPKPVIFKSWKLKLENNLSIYGTKNSSMPVSNLKINIKAGQLYNKTIFAGMSRFYISLLNSIVEYNQFRNKLNAIGATIDFNTDLENISIFLNFPDEHIKRTISLVDTLLFFLDPGTIHFNNFNEYYHDYANETIKENPYFITDAMLKKSYYASGDMMSYTGLGTKKSIDRLYYGNTLGDDLAELIKTKVDVFYVGNVSKEELLLHLDMFRAWKIDTAKQIEDVFLAKQQSANNILFCDKINAKQSSIDIGIKTLNNKSINNYTTLELVNFILNNRLYGTIREQDGLAYGCFSNISNSKYDDIMHVRTNINIDKTSIAVKKLIDILNDFINYGITKDELVLAQKNFIYNINEVPETNDSKLNYLEEIAEIGSLTIYKNKQIQLIKALNVVYVNRFIKDVLKPNSYQISIVSDKVKALPQLQKFGFSITDYTGKLY